MVWTRNKIVGISAGAILLLIILVALVTWWIVRREDPPPAPIPPVAQPASSRAPQMNLANVGRTANGEICTQSFRTGGIHADYLKVDGNPFGVVVANEAQCACQKARAQRIFATGVDVWSKSKDELEKLAPNTCT